MSMIARLLVVRLCVARCHLAILRGDEAAALWWVRRAREVLPSP